MIETIGLSFAVTVFVATAAYTDVCMHRIPNWITVPSALLGLAFHAATGGGAGILASLEGFAVGGALLFVPWLLGGGGMGDVKLLAALGAWLGPWRLLVAFALSMILASAIAIVVMLYPATGDGVSKAKKGILRTLRPAANKAPANRPRRRTLPFAVPLALGTCAVLVWMACKG